MGLLNPKSKEVKNKDWGQEQILIRGAWPLRASFLILTSVYEDQEARNRRKWMPQASGPSHSRSPRRMGSLAARSLARESASRSLAQEGGVAAARRKGHGNAEGEQNRRGVSMPGSAVPMGHRRNTTSTCTFGVGPPGLEGPVRRPSSNPPGTGLVPCTASASCLLSAWLRGWHRG